MLNKRIALLLNIWVLQACFGAAFGTAKNLITTPQEAALIEHAKANGAQVGVEIARSCPSCLRGTFAANDFERGDTVLAVPVKLGILLPRVRYHGWPAEYARGLVQRLRLDAAYNATHSLFMSTWPRQDDILTTDTFPEELLAELQTPELVQLIVSMRTVSEEIYKGTYEPEDYTPIDRVLTGDKEMSMAEFLYYTSMIATRSVALSGTTVPGEDADETNMVWLIPVSDMINHADKPNALRTDNGTHLLVTAKKDIKAGDAVTISYQPLTARNDMSLLLYGFINQTRNKLCAVDLPTYNHEEMWNVPRADTHYYGPKGKFSTHNELVRLTKLLEAMPTSAEEDEQLLAGGKLRDWKEEMAVAFRLGRKQMLKKAIAAVEAVLKSNENAEASAPKDEL